MTNIGSKLLPLSIFMTAALVNCTPSKSNAVSGTIQQTASQLPGSLGIPAVMALPTLSAAESATGDMLATVDGSTDSVIKTAGSTRGSAAFREVALAVPKGSLSGSGTLTIAEGSNLASPLLAEALGVADVAQAGPAVIIAASSVSIVSPLTIALPMTNGLGLSDGILQVVAIIPGADKSQTLQVLASDKIKIADRVVYAEISQFGAYQVVKMSSQPTKTSVPTDLVPVKQPGGGSTTTEIGSALLLASPAGLPSCTQARQGALYYILSLKQFQACDGGEWTVVDLKGDVGAAGAMGAKAPDPAPYFSTKSEAYRFDNGKFINTTTETQYTNYNGQVLRVCKSDSWQEPVTNGRAYQLRNYGDSGCSQNTTASISCDYQFVNINGQCVAPCSNSSLSQCNSRALCEANRMMWDNSSASCKGSCTSTNLSGCLTQAICNQEYFTWSSTENKCLGPCASNNFKACTTMAQCQRGFYDNGGSIISSSVGFWDNDQCFQSCGPTKIPTANGCVDISFCQPDSEGRPQKWTDNTCSNITYEVIEQSQDPNLPVTIRGDYYKPVQIKAGTYDVTADTTFYSGVVIDDNTQLNATGSLALTFKKTARVHGTAEHGVTFGVADSTVKWKAIQFYNNHDHSKRIAISPFDLAGNFKTGTKVTNLKIDGAEGAAITVAGYFSNITINGTPLSFVSPDADSWVTPGSGTSGLYLANSKLALPGSPRFSDRDPTVLFKNLFSTAFSFGGESALMWANRWEEGSGNMYAGNSAATIFNEFDGINCVGGRAFGNTSRTAISTQQGCIPSDNSTDGTVSQKTFAYIHDDYFRPLGSYNSSPKDFYKGAESPKFQVTLLNASGTVASNSIHWVADYVNDAGTVVKIKEADGDTFSFTPPVVDSITLRITSTDSAVELIGVLSRSLNVLY